MNDERLLGLKEVCFILDVCRQTAVGYIHSGLLKAVQPKKNGPYRISRAALDDFLSNQTTNRVKSC